MAGNRPTLSFYGLGGFTPITNTRSVAEFGGTAGERFGADKRAGIMVSESFDYNGRGIDDIEPVPGILPGTSFTPDFLSMDVRQYLYERKRYGFGGDANYKLGSNSTLYLRSLFSDFKGYGDRYDYILSTNEPRPPLLGWLYESETRRVAQRRINNLRADFGEFLRRRYPV
jgi:hypothetical protein